MLTDSEPTPSIYVRCVVENKHVFCGFITGDDYHSGIANMICAYSSLPGFERDKCNPHKRTKHGKYATPDALVSLSCYTIKMLFLVVGFACMYCAVFMLRG